ncbi:phage tail protein [Aliivibrio fischeri]|uniref:phage tail-collar fiber domain-containing protein n=1 Tax=Aliivibrio fischeri TaxID=668 RepID=UPI001F394E71|nr:phage tail protein [Aliivibrio fischeri]MCE7572266.1 phage tail protein [Aliivibrio fischeri]
MSQSIITLAFEQYKAEQEATAAVVELNEFVLANVPNQDPSLPIDRTEGLPAAEFIVHVADTSQEGFVNPNAVVYSLIMDTTIGDFEFNWIGLRNKESGMIAAISHIPKVSKFKTIVGVQNGNAVTRSIMMSYFGAQALTNINVDASTWQIDFTARLFGMDERVRLANVDHYGHATFFNDGFVVQKTGSDYSAKMGISYLGGLRCHSLNAITIPNVKPNSSIYLDVSYQGQLTSQWQSVFSLICSETEFVDYVDEHNVQHYVTKIAEIDDVGNVIDTRFIGGTAEFERADNAATDAEIDSESQEKKHVKLPQLWKGIRKYVLDTLWLPLAELIYPVGCPIPYPATEAPPNFIAYIGQPFDKSVFTKLAERFPSGVMPDMRKSYIRGLGVGEKVLSRKEQSVQPLGFKSDPHGHPYAEVQVGYRLKQSEGSAWQVTGMLTRITGSVMVTGKVTGTSDETNPNSFRWLYITRAA